MVTLLINLINLRQCYASEVTSMHFIERNMEAYIMHWSQYGNNMHLFVKEICERSQLRFPKNDYLYQQKFKQPTRTGCA